MLSKEFNIRIKTADPKQQKDVSRAISELQEEFAGLDVRIKSESKRIIPQEVILLVVVTVASEIVAEAVIRFLDELWNHLKERNISPILSSIDSVQRVAENYLSNIGIVDSEITKREDRGLYVFFAFKSKDSSYRIYVSNSDLKIIKYEKVKS